MQEIEAKFFVEDLDGITVRLQSLEALLIQERILETNIRFDLPGGRLTSEGRVLRLRQDTQARLTYKGMGRNEQGILNRTEIEFAVENYDMAKHFLEALGYQRSFYYEKHRTTYELDNCHIMLDELPYGDFVEIEGESVETIQAITEKLKLDKDAAVPASYHSLFVILCGKNPKLDPAELSFIALNGIHITAEDLSVRRADY
jgi:adenylate cyclase class 2